MDEHHPWVFGPKAARPPKGGLRISRTLRSMLTSTNVYIDGLNLYYGALRHRWPQYKWLDVQSFCEGLLPRHRINRIRYFTAVISSNQSDPDARLRQQIYLRALGTLPKVHIHMGYFLSSNVRMPLVDPPPSGPHTAYVRKVEEKRTDVNLAVSLLLDCFDDDFDEAVVISNDSDMAPAIEIAIDRFGKSVGVVNPHPRNRRSSYLQRIASWSYPSINRRRFAGSQFPRTLTDDRGTFSKPLNW